MYSNLNNDIISTNMDGKAKASLVCTVLNEEEYVEKLIDSVASQSMLPDEFIIVDGQSKDFTQKLIKSKISQYSKKLNIKLLVKKGNRSIGRNEGIRIATNKIILITDSGCILEKNWVKNIVKSFKKKSVDVVAGYYKG